MCDEAGQQATVFADTCRSIRLSFWTFSYDYRCRSPPSVLETYDLSNSRTEDTDDVL